jgi:hypothetical protein
LTSASTGKGKTLTAFTFDGSTARVEIPWTMTPDISSAVTAGTVTFCAWIYPTSTGTERGIMGVGTTTGSGGIGLNLAIDTNNKAIFWYTGTTPATSSTALSANTWYHVCGVMESTASTKIYINGALDVTSTSSTATVAIAAINNKFVVGNEGQAASNRAFTGKIDEAAVWSVALTATQINEIYTKQN